MSVRAACTSFSLLMIGCGSTVASPSAPAPSASSAPKHEITWVTIEPHDGLDLDVRYPHFDEQPLNAAIDADVHAIVDPWSVDAKKSAEGPWHLTIRCEPTLDDAHVASVRCKVEDHRGGAHPKETAVAFNHTRDGRSFSLDQMFVNARKTISDLCVEELARQKAQWIVDGTKDVQKHLHTVNVTPTGILVTFDPFEVGPGAEGFHEVAIPWDRVRTLIDPSGPVAYAR